MRLINAKVLYDELAKIEDSARKEIFKHERSGAEYWMRMGALNQITKLKHFVFDAPAVEAKPVVHGEWIKTFRYMRKNIDTGKLEPVYSCDCPICKYHTGNQGVRFNFCPNCGVDMRGKKNE